MIKGFAIGLIITFLGLERAQAQYTVDTVSIPSGNLTLKGLLWRPSGHGRFPTVIFCHGSYESNDTIHNPMQEASIVGSVFAKKGYIFLVVFRRGVGLSKGQGQNSADLMNIGFKKKGQQERNKIQLHQLETDQLHDMISGLTFLRKRQDVDINRIAVIGHSFGGSLALILSEHDPNIKALVIFAAAGFSWDRSSELRKRLISSVKNINAPILIIHAQNDYSINPGNALDSAMNELHKPHVFRIYPKFGKSLNEGHNLIFLNIENWESDVFNFLDEHLQR